jgi:antitoxin PrlF
MATTSKITAQSQVSVPADVRRRLGVGPGSTLVWETEGDHVVVRRLGAHTSADIHSTLFDQPPKRKSLRQLKTGVAAYMRKRHARD